MDSAEAVVASGLGHLTSFLGSDSLPAIWGARKYYGETGFVGGSVPATEHSIACSHMEILNEKEEEEYTVEVTYDDKGNVISEIELT
jgi:nicotinamide phosphoribosyltransferase